MLRLIGIFLLLIGLIIFLCSSSWTEETDDPYTPWQLLRCNFHVHTNISRTPPFISQDMSDLDHALTLNPEETAFKARLLGIHLGFSDHCLKMTSLEWQELGRVADMLNQEGFPLLGGFEWTPFDLNHLNVFNSADYVVVFDVGAEGLPVCKDLDSFLNWLSQQPETVFVQLNHPMFKKRQFDFQKITQHPSEDRFCLIEVGSGPTGLYSHIAENEPEYQRALQSGLKLAPAIGADNYGPPDQDMRTRHTAVWVEDDSAEGITQAILDRRTYASEDRDIVVKYFFQVESALEGIRKKEIFPMGSEIIIDQSCLSLQPKWIITDPSDKGLTSQEIEIIAVKKEGCFSIYSSRKKQNLPIFLPTRDWQELKTAICWYLRIKQKDGDTVITAPIWLKLSPAFFQSYPVLNTGNSIKELPPDPKRDPKHSVKVLGELSKDLQEVGGTNKEKPYLETNTYAQFSEKNLAPLGYKPCSVFYKSRHQWIYLYLKTHRIPAETEKMDYVDIDLILQGFSLNDQKPIRNNKQLAGCFRNSIKYRAYLRYFIKLSVKDFSAGKYLVTWKIYNQKNQVIKEAKLVFYIYP